MRIHLVNPSEVSFGVGVITPRWLYVLAGATPPSFGDPLLTDETLEQFRAERLLPGDVVGIGIHTSNARRGYELGRMARERGAVAIFGGIHATLYPEECTRLGAAHAVIRGDGDLAWGSALSDCSRGELKPLYEGGKVPGSAFVSARWNLLRRGSYMWASVQTVRGCPKHCSFCSVWRTDGQLPRQRPVDAVIEEIVILRRMGFRFIALADDNFYPITFHDLENAARRGGGRHQELLKLRQERFALMERLARLPSDTIIFTQMTMEAAEDPDFLEAMRLANIKGALVGVESVSEEGLKSMYKGFNATGESLVARLQAFRRSGIHVLGSFIFGLPSDRPDTFDATARLAERAQLTFAQFVPLTPFPGTIDFEKWEKTRLAEEAAAANSIPLTRHWLIPTDQRPKLYIPHPSMSPEEIRNRTQLVWDTFYSLPRIWRRSRCISSLRARLAFVLISKLYRQMYASTGIATDSARQARSARWARLIAKPCLHLFSAPPMPDLQIPQ